MKLAIVGCNGRMGKELLRLAASDEYQFSKVIGVSKEDNFEKSIEDADLIIDFSESTVVVSHLESCVKNNKRYLCGVTGLTDAQLTVFKEQAQKVPVFWSPNMSLGIAVVNALVRQAAKLLDNAFHIKIKETHHIKKIDAPSGTALMLRNTTNQVRNQNIEIESVREGEVIGEHVVTFVSSLEKIKIKHEAFSRAVFADGALKCALWLQQQKAGKLYGMDDMLS